MKNKIFFLVIIPFLAFGCANYVKVIEAKTHLALIDKFDNNSNNWKQLKNKDFLVENSQGVLHIEKFKKNKESNGCLWYSKSFDCLDTKNDFAISFDAKFVDCDDVYNAFDFQWGNLDSISYQLSVDIDGWFKLMKFDKVVSANSRWTDIASNEKPDLIKKNDFNNIYIIQLDKKCIILVNNKVVFNVNINCKGNQIGFQECLKVAWELDNFRIRSIYRK